MKMPGFAEEIEKNNNNNLYKKKYNIKSFY